MQVLETARATARQRQAQGQARVVFPEIDDPRVASACDTLRTQGLAQPVPLTPAPTDAQMAALVDGRGIKEGVARRMLTRPLFRAAAMVAAGEADAMVAGADSPTKKVIEAASIVIGPAEGVQTPSSFFVMVWPDGSTRLLSDCAVNVAPDAEQLADIARASAASARALLGAARVALLSYSTGDSGAGDSVERVRAAAQATGFVGPIQADAALNATIAAKKGLGQGDANVLIFPGLDAGNIAYKLLQELAGAQAIGPILQGFKRPVCDLSRGATAADITDATVLTLALG